MDEKKLHTQEFQLKGIGRNMRCKLLPKRSIGKTTDCSKHLQHIAIERDIFSELNRSIFQISLYYIKLVISKILFILVLCNFNFCFKITWPPPNNITPPPKKSLKGTFKLTFSLYARLVLPVVFLLKAFTVTWLFNSDTEQGTDGLCFLREPVLQWSNHPILII